jgi:2-polyprenyl-3-methyl-5-hydroxy-6-metoxy-1,4-benzoquinol methylase
MENFDRKKHWERIYQTKELKEVSWYQPSPKIAMYFLKKFDLPKASKIIDIGGGDCLLVDHLLEMGFHNITVLDISEAAIERAKCRLGEKANKVKWIVADATDFKPEEKYDFWHDRAAFHFLTDDQGISDYLTTAAESINSSGIMVIGTFSDKGPEKCSGLEVRQYSEASMKERLKDYFRLIECKSENHITPSDKIQQFIFCSFRKLQTS